MQKMHHLQTEGDGTLRSLESAPEGRDNVYKAKQELLFPL